MLTRTDGVGHNWVDTPGPSSLLPVCVIIMVTAGNESPPSAAPSCSDRAPLWPDQIFGTVGRREIKTRKPGEQLAERENHGNTIIMKQEAAY